MNYMKEVAKILGVALNQEFQIDTMKKGDTDKLFFSEDGFFIKDASGNIDSVTPYILLQILTGKVKIILPPYRPAYGDTYYKVKFSRTEKRKRNKTKKISSKN